MKYIKYLSLVFISVIVLSACKKEKNNPGYAYMGKYDMYYTKYYKAYSPNPIFSNSMTNQLPAEGSVSRGNMPFPFATASIGDRAVNQTLAGLQLKNPVQSTDQTIATGKELFNVYCTVCHGTAGKGDGHLYTSGLFPAKPTSLVDTYVQNKPDGEIYYVITAGSISGLMGPHGSQVTSEERWAIINYIRSLSK
jgi:mono/diheme cytochrome c family protein